MSRVRRAQPTKPGAMEWGSHHFVGAAFSNQLHARLAAKRVEWLAQSLDHFDIGADENA